LLYEAGLLVLGYQIFFGAREFISFILILKYHKITVRSSLIRFLFFTIFDSTLLMGLLYSRSTSVFRKSENRCVEADPKVRQWRDACYFFFCLFWFIGIISVILSVLMLLAILDMLKSECLKHGCRKMWSWDLIIEKDVWYKEDGHEVA
jgi:hypothetical protein